MDKAVRSGRIAVAVERGCVVRDHREATKPVRAAILEPLLFTESLDDKFRGGLPACIKNRSVAGRLPITICQPDRIAEGVQLVLPLVQLLLHLREVLLKLAPR